MQSFRRILVLGPMGAGKTVVSKDLSERLGIPVVHLDREFWQRDWEKPMNEAWHCRVKEIAAQEKWIIDGNYLDTFDYRLSRADLVILLNYSRLQCFSQFLLRTFRYLGLVREDTGLVDRLCVNSIWNAYTYTDRHSVRFNTAISCARILNKCTVVVTSRKDAQLCISEVTSHAKRSTGESYIA